MNVSQYKHFRIRDSNDYAMDIEEFIKSIEMQFKIDFTSLSQWRKLIELMNIVQTEFKTKIRYSANRKHEIIRNIYIQNSRPSPFELTDKFARTSKVWQDMKLRLEKRQVSKVKDEPFVIHCDEMNETSELIDEISANESLAHPNTEEGQSKYLLEERTDTELEPKSSNSFHPIAICTNQHKIISSITSNYTPLENRDIGLSKTQLPVQLQSAMKNSLLPIYTNLVRSYPDKIIITNNTLKKQSVKLFLTNCCTEKLYLRILKISDCSHFNNIEVLPCTPSVLFPGLTAVLKIKYTLKNKNNDNFVSSLHFKIARNLLYESSEEGICIPIVSSFIQSRTIAVTEKVFIHPNYSWHVTPKLGYPKAIVHIINKDDAGYYLHIRKRNVDFTKEFGESIKSDEVITPDSESLEQRLEDTELELQNTILFSTNAKQMKSINFDKLNNDYDSVNTVDIVELVLKDLIDVALEPFIFKQTFVRILPRSRKFVFVYFTKVHHIGFHQSYYDFIFTDSKDGDITITKTVKVFSEVLPHPIALQPKILDMSKSPVKFGYWEDYFTITNSHNIFPVTIKITTAMKMKKLFNIIPMETLIPKQSSANFCVKIRSKTSKKTIGLDDLAYFTIKIIIIGHKSVYKDVPPFFYEIIAPCGEEFKRVYGAKYFSDSSQINVSDEIESCENVNVLI
ncbi:uncharacterized protein LOC120633434 [Pararge aegeria]|uniref:uncharacterized protein LOC120633434 n=1 Tax=Pararge aegeria TaxID=116150 RepID=UPI0019D29AA7|nr:uncharacterized protein LOC120633434 [Pararge aegeria]